MKTDQVWLRTWIAPWLWMGLLGVGVGFSTMGCRRGAGNPFTSDLALAESVLRSLQELEQRRKTMETTADISTILSGLKFLEPLSTSALLPPEPASPTGPETPPAAAVMEEVLGTGTSEAQTTVAATAAPPRLQGIVAHPTEPLAILAGQTVGVGDSVGGFRVEKILSDRVVLVGPDGSTLEISLNETVPISPGP